ncbi:CinA family protein [Nesterenkonia sp.]|uniref:CinA family protein n=1 Tax=Nesterenkonia sp. TaxID=704201 RepID=UPI002622916A|nr:CinA family protein [Nesterenkonia sp.]
MAVEGDAEQVARTAEQNTDPVDVVQRCAHRELTLGTAESLTAGALSSRIAEVPGASAVLLGGVVAYSNQVKYQVLEVSERLLEDNGAVDPDVAASMAVGTAERCGTDIGIATTGVAGPEPHQGKDVGTVYLGLACRTEAAERLGLSLPEGCAACEKDVHTEQWLAGSLLLDLDGDRAGIRAAAVEAALKLLEDFLLTEPAGLDTDS